MKKKYILLMIMMLSLIGCSDKKEEQIWQDEVIIEKSSDNNLKIFTELYEQVYGSAIEEEEVNDRNLVRQIIMKIGAKGYPAVDSENQIDMVCASQVEEFCEDVAEKQDAELKLYYVMYDGQLVKYEFQTRDGVVTVKERYFQYENNILENTAVTEYPAYTWEYTEEGYLFFEQYRMVGYDGPSGHNAIRVKPLDGKCRDLNWRYILKVGYGKNDIFLADWDEYNYNDLNFYDIFDIFYAEICGQPLPYSANANSGYGRIYNIPESEFEKVICKHFKIEINTLREKAKYLPETNSYEYRPRGLYDCEAPEIPYPEVVQYVENEDGTLTLTVNAVYPAQNTAKAFVHEVVIRPLEEEGFQYVSNHMITPEAERIVNWHVDRLDEKEWMKFYGEN